MDVLQLDPTNATHVKQFSEIRLRALLTDPAAFDSTYERELAFSDAEWRERLTSFAGHPGAVLAVFADVATAPVGIVGIDLPEPADATVWGMWVAPEGRRRRIAAQLLDSAEAWAAESGAQTATLWVHSSNDGAQALYRSRGYELVAADDLPADVPDACCEEVCMRARLASA
ncbi:MAG: ribosomal protein S18 acetylase RimI-like enzyme [Candidatus Azotimanducaceae bacterium]|jgi:ribosomal protein S18 acetylase RimI-like enzyme|tara:strand:+ start:762 stop:1277 length:516 start_codon:yes stop_codon:yes gene_type:complete